MKTLFRFLLFALLGSLCLGSVFADLTTNNQAYYSFDEDDVSGTTIIDLSGNGNNGTCNMDSGCDTVPGLLRNASDFDGSNDNINLSDKFEGYTAFTVSAWINATSEINNIGSDNMDAIGKTNVFALRVDNNEKASFFIHDGTSYKNTIGTTNININTWYHLVGVYNGSNIKVYVNGVVEGTPTAVTNMNSNTEAAYIGWLGSTAVTYWEGLIDETAIYDRALNLTEIQELYNNGTGFNPYVEQPQITFQNISVNNQTFINNSYFNTSSLNFEVQLNTTNTNNNTNQTYNLFHGNGTLINSTQYATNNLTGLFSLNLSDGAYKINFFAENNETNASTGNYSFNIDTTPANVSVNAFTEWNNGYNVTNLNTTLNITCEDANLVACEIHWDDNTTTNILTTQYKLFTTNGNHTFTLEAHDSANNTVSANGTIFINPYQYFNFNTPTGTPINNYTFNNVFFGTTANFTLYDLTNTVPKNVTLLFEKVGYESTNITIELTDTSGYNSTFNITIAKIVVKIYDRLTEALIDNSTTTLTLIDSVGANATTSTGLYNFSSTDFVNSEYHIIASNPNYETGIEYFNFNNQEIINVNFFLLNSSSANLGTIIIITKDEFSKFVNGALCQAKEWKPSQSAYVTIAEGKTNTNGEVFFDIELGTKEYIFTCTKSGFTATSEPEIIQTDLTERTLILKQTETETVTFLEGLTYTLSENEVNNQSTIQFNYTDTNNEVTGACITFYKLTGYKRTQLSQQCVTGSSANLELTYPTNNSFSLIAVVSISTATISSYTIAEYFYNSNINLDEFLERYNLDTILPVVLFLLALGLGIISKNIYIGLALIDIVVWFSYKVNNTIMPGKVAMTITLFIGIIMWVVYRRK